MSGDNFDEMARKAAEAAERMRRSIDRSAAATINRFLDQSPLVRIQRVLENSPVARLQKSLENSPLMTIHKQLEAAARIGAALENSAAFQAAERIRAAFDNSAAAQVITKLNANGALTWADQKYLEVQSAMWPRDKVPDAPTHEVARVVSPAPASIKVGSASAKVRISAKAKLEYVPAPSQELKIEMPPVHWLASALDFILTKGAFKRTVEPILADIYDEYYDLIKNGDERRAKWIVVRGCLLVIWGQIVRPLVALTGWLTTLRG